jgi:thioredoxin-disulfide reductase
MENYDLAIIGGGPAGMAAGIYAGRLNLKTLLITKKFGGQISEKAVEINNYPGFNSISGVDLVKKIEEHFKNQKVESKIDEVVKIKKKGDLFLIFVKSGKEYSALAVIITSGSEARSLDIMGEKEFLGRGVSYCSVCDGPLFKNKTVAIIGGGNAGFETAIFLANIAKKIYILEFSGQVRAFEENIKTVEKTGKTEVIINARVKEIRGEKFVKSLIYEDRLSNEDKALEVQGVFVEVGYKPASSLAKELVDFSEEGEIEIDFKTCETKTAGLFAAGDVSSVKFKQIIISAGEGAKATLSAYNYIKKESIGK